MAIGDALLTGVQNLKSQWDQWMTDPANRAALLQTGVAMMQPMSVGQNAFGQIGQAIGQGAEAKNRYETTQRSEEQVNYERQQAEANRQFQESQANRNYGLEARKVNVQEKNAASLDAYRKMGPRSLSSMFAKDQDQLTQKLWMAATAEANANNNSLEATVDGYVPKTPQDYLADPAWVQRNTEVINAMPGMPGTTTYNQQQATGAITPPQNPQPGKLPASGGTPAGAPIIKRNPTTGKMIQFNGTAWVPYP